MLSDDGEVWDWINQIRNLARFSKRTHGLTPRRLGIIYNLSACRLTEPGERVGLPCSPLLFPEPVQSVEPRGINLSVA